MTLFFYKNITFQTNYASQDIESKFFNIIKKPSENQELNKLLLQNWWIRISYHNERFKINLKRNTKWNEKSGISSTMKAKIKNCDNSKNNIVSVVVRISNEYLGWLAIFIPLMTIILFYAISNDITQLIIISSIILCSFYILFIIDFNIQLRSYKRIISNLLD